MKKLFCILLCLTLAAGLLPPVASYAEPDPDTSLEEQYFAEQVAALGEDVELIPADQFKTPEPVTTINPIYADYFKSHPLPAFKEEGSKKRSATFSYAVSIYGAGVQLKDALKDHETTTHIDGRRGLSVPCQVCRCGWPKEFLFQLGNDRDLEAGRAGDHRNGNSG